MREPTIRDPYRDDATQVSPHWWTARAAMTHNLTIGPRRALHARCLTFVRNGVLSACEQRIPRANSARRTRGSERSVANGVAPVVGGARCVASGEWDAEYEQRRVLSSACRNPQAPSTTREKQDAPRRRSSSAEGHAPSPHPVGREALAPLNPPCLRRVHRRTASPCPRAASSSLPLRRLRSKQSPYRAAALGATAGLPRVRRRAQAKPGGRFRWKSVACWKACATASGFSS